MKSLHLSPSGALKKGWELTKKHFIVMLGLVLGYMVLLWVISLLSGADTTTFRYWILYLVNLVLSVWVSAGFAKILLNAYDGEEPSFSVFGELLLNDLLKREGIIKHVLDSKTPFKYVAQMAADLSTYLYEKDENYLRYKPHPAISAAEKLKEIKETTNKELVFYKEIEYKYNFIIGSFPELKLYIDNDTELLSMAEYLSYSDLQENRDRSRDFLSNDEWNKLTVSQRNQLALDRYIQKRKKSNWAIGRDYEMACAYSLREKGFSVEMHGIEKRYGDLGRDLIATKFGHTLFDEDSKKGEIFIIQCKCWNKDLHITENVLMQLFGTTIAYQIENKKNFGNGIKIIPVLMIPPFTKLSDMAKNFAEILGIKIMIQEFIDFPRIKCNINGNDKIYHLPFDQQYDTAQIKNKGEFYAYTVAEAEEKGFRRAHRYKGNKNN